MDTEHPLDTNDSEPEEADKTADAQPMSDIDWDDFSVENRDCNDNVLPIYPTVMYESDGIANKCEGVKCEWCFL